MTLAIFGQWQGFGSERGFYRYAQRHLRPAFPQLPTREQFNRQVRQHYAALVACFCIWASSWPPSLVSTKPWTARAFPRGTPSAGAPAGCPGWPISAGATGSAGMEGFHLLLAVNPVGVITGFGFGPASTKDQPLADTFFALRRQPHPGLASVGAPAHGVYVVDKGFEGQAKQRAWWRGYGAQVICPPKRNSKTPWPKRLRRWLAGIRQMVETVYEKLHHTFRLDRERPHDLSGFQARLAAKIALHNFCIWLNEQLGRPRLAFTDLVDW